MNKKFLIWSSIIVVVLIVLGSSNNIVGYQTVQASNQKIITTEVNEKEILFQTMVDMANNREIQKVILGSEITGKRFFDLSMRFSVFNPPVLTEKFLQRAYTMGVMLLRTLSKSKIHSLLERHQVNDQGVQKEISAIIARDATLKSEITQVSNLSCDCDNANTTVWDFPVLCLLLYPLAIFALILSAYTFIQLLYEIMYLVGATLKCFWFSQG